MAALPLYQPFLHDLRIRLAHLMGFLNGYRPYPDHLVAECHHFPDGEEELYVISQDARAETKTR